MKKISLLLVVLLAAGSAGLYGQMAIGTNFQVSGDAKTTAGYDIDGQRFGFKNDASANIKIELVPKSTTTNDMGDMMEPGWVGSIELKDFRIVIDSDDEDSELRYNAGACTNVDTNNNDIKKDQAKNSDCATTNTSRSGLIIDEPDITAKIKNGPLFLQIHSAPENEADLVAHIEDDENTEDDPMGDRSAEGDDDGKDVGLNLGGQGLALGYDSGDLQVSVGITSDLPWDKTGTDEGSFVVSGNVGVLLGPAGLKLQVVQGIKGKDDEHKNADDTGFGAELGTVFGEGRAVTLRAGADLVMTNEEDDKDTPDNESMDWEFGASADVALVSMGDNSTTVGAKYIMSSVKDVASDVMVTLTDAGGLVDRLGMGLTWGMFDISGGKPEDDADKLRDDQADMFLEGKLSYRLDAMGGALTPEATVTLNSINGETSDLGLKVAAVLTEAVPATEFGLQWETKRLTEIGDNKASSGAITAWAKIVYG